MTAVPGSAAWLDALPRRTDWNTTPQDILACFHLLLGRDPNPEEIGHFSRVGVDLKSVVATFVNSLEFSLRGLHRGFRSDDLQEASVNGVRMLFSPTDMDVGVNVKAGSYEPHVTRELSRRLKPGMGFVDIGANIGFFALMGSRLVGPSGRVVAVEPNPDNVRLIEASRRLNGFDHLSVLQTAAGRNFGLLMLNASFTNGTAAALPADATAILGARTVAVSPLDRLLPDDFRVDVIKIDVEGGEAAALDGAAALLERDHPAIITEFNPALLAGISRTTSEAFLGKLVRMGYTLSVLHGDLSVQDCGQDVSSVTAAHAACGFDHIDVLAVWKGADR